MEVDVKKFLSSEPPEKEEPTRYEEAEIYHILRLPTGDLRLFKSMSPKRLPEETQDEYKMRRRYVNDTLKKHKQKGYKDEKATK